MKALLIEPSCFISMVMSAVEVFSKETTGFLIGKGDKRFIEGKLSDCIVIESAYPLQTAKRGFSTVSAGSMEAFHRAKGTVNAIGFEILGEYHSHPKDDSTISDDDRSYIEEQMKTMNIESGFLKKKWVEIIIGIDKREYETTHKPGWYPEVRGMGIKGVLKTSPYIGYPVTISGYLYNMRKFREMSIFYSIY